MSDMISDKEIDKLVGLASTHPRTAIVIAFCEGRLRSGKNSARYIFLRERDLDTISTGGLFVGLTPENVVINGSDLDDRIDKAMSSNKESQADQDNEDR